MLRRHITPALLVFCIMLASCSAHRLLAGRAVALVFACAACSSAGIVLARTEHEKIRRAGILLVASGFGFLLGSWSVMRMEEESRAAHLSLPQKDISAFRGHLLKDSVLSLRGDTLLLLGLSDVTSRDLGVTADARGTVMIRLRGDYRFSLGQELAVTAPLKLPGSGAAESFTSWVERGELTRGGYSSPAWSARAAVRDWVHRAISRAGYPASALMEALLIGSREDVPADLYDGFRKTGSLHILALSGLHVAVLYALLVALLGFLRDRLPKLLIATGFLVFYQVIAGFMPSLLRATIMIIVGGVGLLLDRDAEPINLLAISGILVLLAIPQEAFSLSFQLSYLALGGIFVLGPVVQRLLADRLPKLILAPLAMSVAAQMATFPLIAVQFGVYFPSGLLAGLLLVPLTTAVLWGALGWLVVIMIPWPLLHDLGAHGFAILYQGIAQTASIFGRLPGVTIRPPVLPWVLIVSLIALAYLSFFVPARRRARA
ncbi:MAG TPA: ComEC/Rec2 family competence protein [Spirochaetia bacterium]|nr:ComEC/Rec2 family competence protein [Spirochaetia bacterium]